MANSFEIIEYKEKIASRLINSEELIRLLGNSEIENPDELIGQNIFNFVRYPYSPEEEICFICIEVDIPNINSVFQTSKLTKTLEVIFYIVCHERLMPTNDLHGATRTDLISAEIDRLFNNNYGIGIGKMHLKSNVADAVSVKHRMRTMVFEVEDINDNKCRPNE